MKKIITTEKAPKAIGPYSQAIQCGSNCLFVWANSFKSSNYGISERKYTRSNPASLGKMRVQSLLLQVEI